MTEHLETIVDKDYPKKQDLEDYSSSNTNEIDNLAGGPSFGKTFNKINPSTISQ